MWEAKNIAKYRFSTQWEYSDTLKAWNKEWKSQYSIMVLIF